MSIVTNDGSVIFDVWYIPTCFVYIRILSFLKKVFVI